MKKQLLFIITTVGFAFCALAQAPTYSWAKQTSGITNPDASANSSAIAVDTVNHFVYTGGNFSGGSINFGSGELDGNSGSSNIYLAKHNLNGGLIWAKSFYGNHGCSLTGVAVDNSGNVFITGMSENDTMHIGSQYLINTVPDDADHELGFVAKLDANGNTLWLKGSSGGGSVLCNAIAIDAAGNVYVTGHVFDAAGMAFGNTATEGGFFMKLNGSTGTAAWFKQTTPAAAFISQGTSIAVDKAGNCIVAGTYAHDISFGSINVSHSVGTNVWDRFVTKINATTGAFVWAYGSGIWQGPDYNYAVSLDLQNNIYLTGFLSIATAGSLSTSYIEKQFVEKLNPSGVTQWMHTYKLAAPLGISSIATDKKGFTFVTYNVADTVIYGNDTVIPNPSLPQNATIKLAILKLNSAGNVLYAKTNGDPVMLSYAVASSIAVDTAGAAYICGTVSQVCKFDATTLNAGSGNEFLLAKLGGSFVSGIHENKNKNAKFSIYPNPAANKITVNSQFEKSTLRILDLNGKEINKYQLNERENEIDTAQLPAGVYFVELQINGNRSYQKMIIEK